MNEQEQKKWQCRSDLALEAVEQMVGQVDEDQQKGVHYQEDNIKGLNAVSYTHLINVLDIFNTGVMNLLVITIIIAVMFIFTFFIILYSSNMMLVTN